MHSRNGTKECSSMRTSQRFHLSKIQEFVQIFMYKELLLLLLLVPEMKLLVISKLLSSCPADRLPHFLVQLHGAVYGKYVRG